MKKIIITAMLLVTLPLLLGADESELEKEKARLNELYLKEPEVFSLYGLEGVSVLVEHLGEESKSIGLTVDQLKTDIELKLRLAGIKVLSLEERIAAPGSPYLYCNINLQILQDISLTITDVSLQLNQEMYLRRDSDKLKLMNLPNAVGTTWKRGSIGSAGNNKIKNGIRESVKDYTDEFINDYLTANPKKQSTNSNITSEMLAETLKSIPKADIVREFVDKVESTPLKYTSEEDAFSVSFPSTPQKTTLSYKEPLDTTVRNYQSVLEKKFVQYNVFCEYLNDKKILSDESQEAYFNGKLASRLTLDENTSVIKDKKTSFRGFNAHEFKYISTHEGIQMTHEGVTFFVDGDSFVVQLAPNQPTPLPTFEEFIGSFELLPLEPVLQDKFTYDESAKVKIKAPESFYESSNKEEKVILELANKNAHSIQIFDVHAFFPSFKMSDIKNEYPLAKSDLDGDLLNTVHLDKYNINLIQKIRFRKIKGRIYMIQSASPESTFFRYKKLFKASMDTFSEATRT